ncbi:MAG: helix-turn-helix transcriptional regulator [Oscillospiraceae bacterium]|nr:helix-turn-helix transcriptional regulator [Oscillospiraceae bacterium]
MILFGENLKKLRKGNDLTQEQLADILGVSPQAVSRWEIGTTYPDITMLPTIANYFDVTLDDLIGMDKIKEESSTEKIFDEYRVNFSKGRVDKNIELLREALKRYPKNEQLLFCYAASLSSCMEKDGRKLTEDEIKQNTLEAIKVDERLLESCTDLSLRISTIKELSFHYNKIGETEKAIELAESLPGIWQTGTTILDNFYTGEKRVRFLQDTILNLADAMYHAVIPLSDLNYENDELTTEERIEMIGKCIRIFETIFENGDYYFYSVRMSDMYRYTAAMDMLIGRHEEALSHLEAAAKYAVMNDTLPEKGTYTSLLINGLEFDLGNTAKNFTFTKCDELHDKLLWDRYDAIRTHKRFTDILEQISRYRTSER